ncbi:hypothetical protein OsccyDRAFT_2853 [Leptolyngbyaceae cyanobacterium JSC-12]|nr:hypothetical protein OsccyDRAFT_2853 [Leptolyngbyaceae cyanobacterium JSC-12]
MADLEKESEKQKGFSKEAWTAMSAIAVALIGGMVTIFTTIWKEPPPKKSSNAPSGAPTSPGLASINPSEEPPISPRPSSTSSSVPTITPKTSPVAQELVQDLEAVNIDFSDPKALAQLNNPFSNYPQFATGCLNLLKEQRLKKKTYFDVIFWNYTEDLKGQINTDSPNGDVDTNILKSAMISAYNTRNGTNALSFGDIVESRQ